MLIKDASVWNNTRMKVAGGIASEIYQKIGGVWRKDISNNNKHWFDIDVGTSGVFTHVMYHYGSQYFSAITPDLKVIFSKDGNEWLDDDGYPIGIEFGLDNAKSLHTSMTDDYFIGYPVEVDNTSTIIGSSTAIDNFAIGDGLVSTYGNLTVAYNGGTEFKDGTSGPATGTTIVVYNQPHWGVWGDWGAYSDPVMFPEGFEPVRANNTFYIPEKLLDVHVILSNGYLIVIPKYVEETRDYYYIDYVNPTDNSVMTKGELPVLGTWNAVSVLANGTVGMAKSNSNVFLHMRSENPTDITVTELPRVGDWSCMASQGNQFMLLASDSDQGLRTSSTGDILDWDLVTSVTNANWHSISPYNGGYVAITRDKRLTQVTFDGNPWQGVYQQRDGMWSNVVGMATGTQALASSPDRVNTIASLDWSDPANTQPFVLFDINMNTIGEHGIQQIHTCTFGTDDIYALVFRDLIPGYGREVGTYFTIHKAVPGIVTLDNLGDPLYTSSEIFASGGYDYDLIDSLKVFDASCFRSEVLDYGGLPESKIVISFSEHYDGDSAPVSFNANSDILIIRNEDDSFYNVWAGEVESMPLLPSWMPRSGSGIMVYGPSVSNLSRRNEIQPSVVMQFIPFWAETLRKNVMAIEEFHPH